MNAPNETELEVVALLDILHLTLSGDRIGVFYWEGRASLDALDAVLQGTRAVAEAQSRQALPDAPRAVEQARDEYQKYSAALHAAKNAINDEPRVVALAIIGLLLELIDRRPGAAALQIVKTFIDAWGFENFCLAVLARSSFAAPQGGSIH